MFSSLSRAVTCAAVVLVARRAGRHRAEEVVPVPVKDDSIPVPADPHCDRRIDPGEDHISHGGPSEVLREHAGDPGGFAGGFPSCTEFPDRRALAVEDEGAVESSPVERTLNDGGEGGRTWHGGSRRTA